MTTPKITKLQQHQELLYILDQSVPNSIKKCFWPSLGNLWGLIDQSLLHTQSATPSSSLGHFSHDQQYLR